MKTILSALLWYFKTMKGGKVGPVKYYYFLLQIYRGISWCAIFDNMRELKMAENKNNSMNRM